MNKNLMIDNSLLINPKEILQSANNTFFDLDETLILTDRANNMAYHEAAKLLGLKLAHKKRITKLDLPFNELTNQMIIRLKNNHYNKFLKFTSINNSYYDLLLEYHKFTNCFIISSGQFDRVSMVLKYHNIESYFKYVYTSIKDKPKFIHDTFKGISVLFDTDYNI